MSLAPSVHENWQISLWQVARSSYETLDIDVARPQWAFSFVREGHVQKHVGGRVFDVPRGHLMVHPPHLPYSEKSAARGVHEWLVFEARVRPGADLLRLHPLPPVLDLGENGAHFSAIFERLLAHWNADAPFRALHCAFLAGQIVTLALDCAPRNPTHFGPDFSSADARFTDLIEWMRGHLGEKIVRETLAKRLHLHPNSLDRAFGAELGQTPLQMLREMRLERARELLETTNWTLDLIAQKSGLENDAYFSRVFRKRYGQSPGAYRKGVKKAVSGYLKPEIVSLD